MTQVTRLSKLFNGLTRAYGEFREDRGSVKDSGKVGGRARTMHEELTAEIWQKHIDGKVGLGVVPILDDGTCWFSAIDFDKYDKSTVARFVHSAKASGVPLVWCKSKSGGAHLYTFYTEPADAAKVREKLSQLARSVGYPKIEIFPKQERLDVSRGEVGNWINLPYYSAEYTNRFAYDANNEPIESLDAFLDYAESTRIDPLEFYKIKIVDQEIPFSDAPPCIQTMAHQGVSDGSRNKALFQFSVYAKKRHPDDWQEQVLKWNEAYFSPKLAFKEVQATIFKSLEGDKEYGYLCKDPVCSEVCNKSLCQTREFGIMGGLVQVWDDWQIEGVRKIIQTDPEGAVMTDEPPRYILSINGQDVHFSRPELTSNLKFREKVFEVLDKLPPRMNNAMWDQMIQHWLINRDVIEIPFELTATGNIASLLRDFIDHAPAAKGRKEIRAGMVLCENGRYLFHYVAFSKFLHSQRVYNIPASSMWKQLHALGAERHQTTTSGNRKLNYWSIPEDFTGEDEEDVFVPYDERLEF